MIPLTWRSMMAWRPGADSRKARSSALSWKILAECGGIGVHGDQADVSFAQQAAPGVGTLDAGAE